MSTLVRMVFITGGIMLLMYFTGLMGENPTILQLLAPESMQLTDISSIITGALLSVGAAVAIGYWTQNLELAVATSVVVTILNMAAGMVNVYQVLASGGPVSTIFALLLFGPIGYTLVLFGLEWWRGFQS